MEVEAEEKRDVIFIGCRRLSVVVVVGVVFLISRERVCEVMRRSVLSFSAGSVIVPNLSLHKIPM